MTKSKIEFVYENNTEDVKSGMLKVEGDFSLKDFDIALIVFTNKILHHKISTHKILLKEFPSYNDVELIIQRLKVDEDMYNSSLKALQIISNFNSVDVDMEKK